MATDRGEYRPIYTALLDGPDFQAMRPEVRWTLVALKLSLGMLGMAVVPGLVGALAERTGYSEGVVTRALKELEDRGWIQRERNVAWLVRGFEFEPSVSPDNPRHRTSVQRQIAALPRLPIVDRFRRAYPEWFDGAPEGPGGRDGHSLSDSLCDSHSDSLAEASRITETRPETVPETETGTAARRTRARRHDVAGLEPTPEHVERVRAQVPTAYVHAFDGFLAVARNGFAFLSELELLANPEHRPHYPWATLGQTLHELAAANAPCTPQSLRTFADKILARDLPTPAATTGTRPTAPRRAGGAASAAVGTQNYSDGAAATAAGGARWQD